MAEQNIRHFADPDRSRFFRDAESFEVLKTVIFPELLKSIGEGATFRAWVPGCATGEEVYSLAMVLRETLDQIPRQINLQLFGTDKGLRIALSSAIRKAVSSEKPVISRKIAVKTNGDVQMIDLHVPPQRPFKELSGHLLVVFAEIVPEPMSCGPEPGARNDGTATSSQIDELEGELQKSLPF